MAGELQALDDLASEVERYEQADSLTPEEYSAYAEAEISLETQLLDIAISSAFSFDFDTCFGAFDYVLALNRTLQRITQRELERAGNDDASFRERLSRMQDEATGLIALTEGEKLLYRSDERRIAGDMSQAFQLLGNASDLFQELGQSDLPQSGLGAIEAALCSAKMDFFSALREMQAGRYEAAKEQCQRVRAVYSQLLEEVAEEMGNDGESADARLSELQRQLVDQFTYSRSLLSFVDFLYQMKIGNIDLAVEYATDAVKLGEEWLKTIVSQDLPQIMQNLRRMELEQYHGWLDWAQAEYAIDQRRWHDCRDHIRAAQQHWANCADYVLRHNMLRAFSQIESLNMDVIVQGTLRRCRREEQLYEEIDRLREEKRQAGNVYVGAYGGNAMSSRESYDFHGNVGNIGAVGSNAQGTVNNQQATMTLGDLGVLAEQLAQLGRAMAAGSATDVERNATEQVKLAEQAARNGDESSVRRYLVAAGKWAGEIAKQLALVAAETAIKVSLGG